MGRGACQLGRTAGVEIGEEESGGSTSGGRERTWENGRFVASGAMRELRQGFWAFHAMWEVQSGDLLYADVSGRSLQRAQIRMSSHKYSFKEWFGDEIERSSTNPLLVPPVFKCPETAFGALHWQDFILALGTSSNLYVVETYNTKIIKSAIARIFLSGFYLSAEYHPQP